MRCGDRAAAAPSESGSAAPVVSPALPPGPARSTARTAPGDLASKLDPLGFSVRLASVSASPSAGQAADLIHTALDRRVCGHCREVGGGPFWVPSGPWQSAPQRERLPCRPPCSRPGISSSPCRARVGRVSGPMTHSFWACDRAWMRLQPPLLQLRPASPSAGVQSARPAGRLRPGALVYRMPAPAGRSSPPHSPIVRSGRALSGLANWVFPGSQHRCPAVDLPVSLLFWNLPSAHPPVLCPHHLAPWVPTPSTSEL